MRATPLGTPNTSPKPCHARRAPPINTQKLCERSQKARCSGLRAPDRWRRPRRNQRRRRAGGPSPIARGHSGSGGRGRGRTWTLRAERQPPWSPRARPREQCKRARLCACGASPEQGSLGTSGIQTSIGQAPERYAENALRLVESESAQTWSRQLCMFVEVNPKCGRSRPKILGTSPSLIETA